MGVWGLTPRKILEINSIEYQKTHPCLFCFAIVLTNNMTYLKLNKESKGLRTRRNSRAVKQLGGCASTDEET